MVQVEVAKKPPKQQKPGRNSDPACFAVLKEIKAGQARAEQGLMRVSDSSATRDVINTTVKKPGRGLKDWPNKSKSPFTKLEV